LEEKVAAPVQKTENTAVGIRFTHHATPLYPQKLALASTSGGLYSSPANCRCDVRGVCRVAVFCETGFSVVNHRAANQPVAVLTASADFSPTMQQVPAIYTWPQYCPAVICNRLEQETGRPHLLQCCNFTGYTPHGMPRLTADHILNVVRFTARRKVADSRPDELNECF
jgi:hypothetical protein